MKIPIECPHGCGRTLEIDMSKDHQHIQCYECLCVFCAVCVDAVAVSITAEELHLLEGASKAHLN